MKNITTQEPELSRPLQVDKISAGGMAEHIVANKAEKKALSERFGILDIKELEASLDIDHSKGGAIAVTGSMKAEVVQQCVVSLEPVPAHIEDKIDILFAPSHMLEKGANSPHSDEVENDAPEPIVNGVIDLGELVSQHLAIALNPYPRKEGVELIGVDAGGKGEEVKNNPFSKLKGLNNNNK